LPNPKAKNQDQGKAFKKNSIFSTTPRPDRPYPQTAASSVDFFEKDSCNQRTFVYKPVSSDGNAALAGE
jgi:hypothetical protein